MLINDLRQIGNKLLQHRKERGLTQAELAERAGLADRTYADIERGTVNMRVITLMKICGALKITPNDVLLSDDEPAGVNEDQVIERLRNCPASTKQSLTSMIKILLDEVGR